LGTLPFCSGPLGEAKVLVIGHDPRLARSATRAPYAFFGDMFFREIPTKRSELAKYRLAETVYGYIAHLTSYRFRADEIVLTNLCNDHLPPAPKGRTVLIPREKAEVGIHEINDLLAQSRPKLIFAMPQQVNYWLQALRFCAPDLSFLERAEPKGRGLHHSQPYYEPKGGRAFQLICGRRFETAGGDTLYAILHVKNWPLKESFLEAYSDAYRRLVNDLK